MRNADILVVGLGAMGSAALYHLARRGVPAVGIEQFQLGHALGSSHGFSRIFRDIYHDPFYVELAGATIPLWQELDSLAAEKLMHFTGLLYFSRPGNINIEQKVEAMEALKRPIERPTPQEVASRYPALRLPPDTVTCFTSQAGLLNVGRCILEHLHQAQRAGATIHEQVRVHRVDISQETPLLETSAGQFRCDRLIISPGPWAPEVLEDLSLPLHVTRQQEFYFRPQNRAPYQPGGTAGFWRHGHQVFTAFPTTVPGVKTADDGLGVETSPGQVDRELDLGKRDDLQEWLENHYARRRFHLRRRGDLYVYKHAPTGTSSSAPTLEIRTSWSPPDSQGTGSSFSTLVGKILSDLAADGATEYPIDRFRPDRFEKAGSP